MFADVAHSSCSWLACKFNRQPSTLDDLTPSYVYHTSANCPAGLIVGCKGRLKKGTGPDWRCQLYTSLAGSMGVAVLLLWNMDTIRLSDSTRPMMHNVRFMGTGALLVGPMGHGMPDTCK
jgi:hypothetical protein